MLCPEVTVPELSGPSASWAGSTPVTVNELLLIDPDPEPPWPPGRPPPAGTVPESFTSFRTSAPAAPETSFRPDTVVTDEDLIVPIPPPARMSRLKLVPAFCCPGGPPPKLKRGPPPEPAVGDWGTVTPVPTPQSERGTRPWGAGTPPQAAVTVMARPHPPGSAAA